MLEKVLTSLITGQEKVNNTVDSCIDWIMKNNPNIGSTLSKIATKVGKILP